MCEKGITAGGRGHDRESGGTHNYTSGSGGTPESYAHPPRLRAGCSGGTDGATITCPGVCWDKADSDTKEVARGSPPVACCPPRRSYSCQFWDSRRPPPRRPHPSTASPPPHLPSCSAPSPELLSRSCRFESSWCPPPPHLHQSSDGEKCPRRCTHLPRIRSSPYHTAAALPLCVSRV